MTFLEDNLFGLIVLSIATMIVVGMYFEHKSDSIKARNQFVLDSIKVVNQIDSIRSIK